MTFAESMTTACDAMRTIHIAHWLRKNSAIQRVIHRAIEEQIRADGPGDLNDENEELQKALADPLRAFVDERFAEWAGADQEVSLCHDMVENPDLASLFVPLVSDAFDQLDFKLIAQLVLRDYFSHA